MNIVEGLAKFKARKNLSNNQLAEMLGCSPSVISLYCSGKSGISLEKLEILFQNGMFLDEAFSSETAVAIRRNIGGNTAGGGVMDVSALVDGLQKLIDIVKAKG